MKLRHKTKANIITCWNEIHVLVSNFLESKVIFWVTYSIELSRHVPFVAAIVVAHLKMRLFPGFFDPIP